MITGLALPDGCVQQRAANPLFDYMHNIYMDMSNDFSVGGGFILR